MCSKVQQWQWKVAARGGGVHDGDGCQLLGHGLGLAVFIILAHRDGKSRSIGVCCWVFSKSRSAGELFECWMFCKSGFVGCSSFSMHCKILNLIGFNTKPAQCWSFDGD